MAKLQQRQVGELDCLVYTTATQPELLVALCHGFGAPGDDLVSLGAHFLRLQPELLDRVQFVFPAAPLDLSGWGIPRGRAWWELDIEQLQRSIELGEFRNLRSQIPPGLSAARLALTQVIEDLRTECGLDWNRVVLGGFSQGAMLATEVALQQQETIAGLLIWSGTLLNESAWRTAALRHHGMRVFQSHGRQDNVLPHIAAEWLRDLLREAGMDNEFFSFLGGHAIPQDVLVRSAEFLHGVWSAGRPVSAG